MKKLESKDIQLNLTGFSGNKVEAHRIDNFTIIRKTARNEAENDKLNFEFNKLKKLSDISRDCKLFQIPEIISSGFDNDKNFYYELEFIPGENLDSALKKFNPKKILEISQKLTEIIKKISSYDTEKNKIQNTEINFIKTKFNEISIYLKNKNFSLEMITDLSYQYDEKIQNLNLNSIDLLNTQTFCHGDIALDNVLITRNDQIYLIDPLKNNFESIMWDYAKILQSSYTHWNLIKHNNFDISVQSKKIKIKPDEHMLIFHQHFVANLNKDKLKQILLYLSVNMARIVKHAKNEKQICALMLITNELLTNYNDGRYDLNGSLNSLRW